jgi:insulysin
MMRSFGYLSTKMANFFIIDVVVIVFLSWLSWNRFSPYYDSIVLTTSHTTSSSTGFCHAFVPHYGVRQLLKLKQIPNKCVTTTTTLSCHDDFCDVDNDDDCEYCEGKWTTPRRSKDISTNEQRQNHNPSRRDFFAWNSVLAGIASGTLSVRGTNAEEISNDITTIPTTDLDSKVNDNYINNDQYAPYSSVRRYKTVELSNGMTVLLVSDKTAIQSSAALTINDAGQFAEPPYLNGLAHLMEHITLSSQAGRSNQGDFQEWLDGDYAEGFSNGFTAYEKVCFHFQCETSVFPEALDRFSNLFLDKAIKENCHNKEAVKREIRRVNSELDKNDLFTRELYLTKSLINPNHPYAKMTLGSIETLERLPAEADINVSKELYDFFTSKYQPDQTILVVVSSSSLSSLESMVQPFASTLSRQKKEEEGEQQRKQRIFPNFLLPGKLINPICLFRGKVSNEILADDLEKISFQWALDQDYRGLRTNESYGTGTGTTTKSSYGYSVVTATEIGFVMAEILGRRGPGSLFQLLKKRKWVPEGSQRVPRISFPVDVSGFQIMRLEIVLTLEGFAKRSSVIAAVYECLGCLRSSPPSRQLISQYCTVAQLYGHVLAPRPPDAIELAFDGQIYGVDGPHGVGTPGWRLMPPPEDVVGVQNIQRTIQAVLNRISDPSNSITIVTASQRAIQSSRGNGLDEPFPLFSPASWDISPITQARFLPQNNILAGKINDWLVARLMEEKLQPPVLNPLIPPTLRPPRIPLPSSVNTLLSSSNEVQHDNLQVFATTATPSSAADTYAAYEDSYDPTKSSLVRDYWALLKVFSHNDDIPTGGLSLPRMPPENSSRSAFVLQLMSSRPPRASAEMAAHSEVWRISLEYALSDLAELGAPAGLAYEISYNKFGMRVCFLGLSQNIASYSRRLCRRIVDHTNQLLEGPDQIPDLIIDASIRNTNRFRMSSRRKRLVLNTLRQTTASDAAREGTSFFNSCSGGVCFAQGDMLPSEALSLLADLKKIFRQTTGANVLPFPAVPDVDDLLYKANWIPRSASVCTISGATLISNPCGRVPR